MRRAGTDDLDRGIGAELVEAAAEIRPTLRGVLHAVTFPLAIGAGVVLIVLAPAGGARVSAVVYSVTAWALFGTSAVYHLGRWSPRTRALLGRVDHSNIYLIIAGSYTPFGVLALRGSLRVTVLAVIWAGAAAGVVLRAVWSAPRWLHTPLYVLLGWVAVFVLPQLLHGAGPAPVALIIVGGLLYTLGGIVYARKRPDPAPAVFGFHEVFHALTVAGFAAQYVAVLLVTHAAS